MHDWRDDLVSKRPWLGWHEPVLVDTHDVEPVRTLFRWPKEFDPAISESSEKSLVSDITHTIECEFRLSFLQKNRLDVDVVRFMSSSIVIH